jgi:cystathionine beta-lyase family protein involved in aluminum resistance
VVNGAGAEVGGGGPSPTPYTTLLQGGVALSPAQRSAVER